MRIHIGDFCVVAGALSGLVFVLGMATGEHRARHQIATVCEQQPGAVLASSHQDPRADAISCSYLDNMPTARQLRRAAAVRRSM